MIRDTEHFRLDSMTTDDGDRNALALLENGGEEVARLDRLTSGAARLMERKLEHQLGRRCHAQVADGCRAEQVEVALERLHDLVRIQVEVAHDLRERVPLNLRERQEDVLVGDLGVVPAPGFLDSAVYDALC